MKDLERVGIKAQGMFLNHILKSEDCLTGFALERWKLQQYYLHKAGELYNQILCSQYLCNLLKLLALNM